MIRFAFDHIGLSVGDLDAQRRFYGEALGLIQDAGHLEISQAKIRTALLRSPSGLQIELIERGESVPQNFADAQDGAGTQGYFHWALAVDDLNAAFDGVLAAGATQVSPPGGRHAPGSSLRLREGPRRQPDRTHPAH